MTKFSDIKQSKRAKVCSMVQTNSHVQCLEARQLFQGDHSGIPHTLLPVEVHTVHTAVTVKSFGELKQTGPIFLLKYPSTKIYSCGPQYTIKI